MLQGLCIAAALSAVLAIMADWNETKPRIFYVLKPLTTILIAGIALQAADTPYRDWIVAGLLLSMIGDICLMFHGNAAFIGGLSSFMLAHLVFMWAFVHDQPLAAVPVWAAAYVVYGIAFSVVLLPRAGSLKLPVLLYGAVLMAMAITASIRSVQVDDASGGFALIGASLFVLSDSALGARKFIGPYRGAQGLILSTYWAAIGLIAGSALYVS